MLGEIRTLIRAREAARSSGRAVTRVSDPHTEIEHHHTPKWASGSGVSTVPKPFAPDVVDAFTQSEPLDALLDALIRALEVARCSGQAAARVSVPNNGVEHHHTFPTKGKREWSVDCAQAFRPGHG
eukprot:6155886-Pleurochrysis_carterae.AAC.2